MSVLSDFILTIMLLLILLTLIFVIKYSLEAFFSNNWPKVEGKVESSYCNASGSSVFTFSVNEERTYKPDIIYLYEVDEKEYRSKRVKVGIQNIKGSMGWAQGTVTKYSKGAIVDVFYNPKSPKKAVLEVGFNLRVILIPIISLIIFLLLLSIPYAILLNF